MTKKRPLSGVNGFAQRDFATVYFTGALPWLPHYTTPDLYAAPTGEERTEKQLVNAGAVKATDYLWPRQWQQGGAA